MSSEQGIRLSTDLIAGMLELIAKHDEQARGDQVVGIQYLVAVAGYLVGSYPGPDGEREALLEHLGDFMKHVANDRVQAGRRQSGAPAERRGSEVATDDPAMGIWRPD